ncbi:patatin-like phospholipase family protein [Mariniphaga sp.]|uniref:patatin-like phospholipase family protein n=1 Tax=Mariniphaga sp. TaxID=1954475 RepID=UPI00356227DA
MKKIGLALGGGAVLGAAHVGVLKAIEELDLEISYIAGTSIGAFVAAFYAFGKTPAEIEEIALKLTWMDISGISLFKNGLLSNEKLGDLISEYIGNEKIENAKSPLAMIATDIFTGKKVVLKKGNVAKGVMASTCLPGIFIPVEMNDVTLVDGGIVENVPIDTIKEMGADYVVGVDLNAKNKYEKPNNILDVIMNSFHFTLKAAAKYQTENADLLIMPDLSEFNMADTSQVKDLIEQGYKDSKKLLKKHLA